MPKSPVAPPTLRLVPSTAHEAARPVAVDELVAVREIVHAFLTADRAEDVYQFALDRVGPLVGCALASVYVVDEGSELMRLAAAFNWPERYRAWLGEMRVRLGFGPSGEAASERRAIEIPDLLGDEDLEDWQEIASELGFRSLVALPLQSGSRVLGAVTFYFAGAGACEAEKRGLLRIVADQMAATAEKAGMMESLRRANAALVDANAELERQYLAIVDARRVRDEFLANMSHELRTPLTSVLGHIAILDEGISGPLTENQRADLGKARGAGERLLAMIEDLLEMTSLARGGMDVAIEELDPLMLLRDTAGASLTLADGVAFRIDEPVAPLALARGDRRRIAKILAILIGNACKFTERGEIVASVETADGRLVYRVRDTGIGIAREALALVFDEFRQVDGSATRRYGGSGLGLALARRLARLLDGDVTLASTSGEGSTFTVDLPLRASDAAREA